MTHSLSKHSHHTPRPEEIDEDLFRLRIPLPETSLKYLNAYVARGKDRHLVVDVGLNLEVCRSDMLAGLDILDIALERTDFFITHFHADHLGLLPDLAGPSSTVYFNNPEARLLNKWKGTGDMIDFSVKHGFPIEEIRQAFAAHPVERLRIDQFPIPTLVKDGYNIAVGSYRFRCVHTPGHTPGHMCLYEPQRKILIAGDHLLTDISPNIVCWSNEENPLKHYIESLDKVANLEVDMVLPGHRRVFHEHRRRVTELKAHHERRLNEVQNIIASGKMNAYQVAEKMTWEFGNGNWDTFPVTQQWFATGEALAHLRYLEESGTIQCEMVRGVYRFQRVLDST